MWCLLTGGERSGKSRFARELALSLSVAPVHVATARVWDDEFMERIERHKRERSPAWTSYEEEKALSALPLEGRVAVIDCVTLWLTNFFADSDGDIDRSLEEAMSEIELLSRIDASLIFVTNELGMGGHAMSETGRRFSTLHGLVNQELAKRAGVAALLVCGLPITLKGVLPGG